MASVCNLFNKFSNQSGNFMMFSQYTEDITRNYSDGDEWKVVPTKFIALDIDYDKINKELVAPNENDLNISIPKYFQNCFENACAYGKSNYDKWTSETSRNLFWNCMFDGEFLHQVEYGKVKIVDEIMYYGSINMHSYNEHKGMGYGEIYCYIPTNAAKKNCQVTSIEDVDPSGRVSVIPPDKDLLEGHRDKYIDGYKQEFFYNKDFNMSFEDSNMGELLDSADSSYNINTVVVLYSIFKKINDSWETVYSDIPMGMYITGLFNTDNTVTNTVSKYVTTSYGTGTSYGLRICTRFLSMPNGSTLVEDSEIVVDDSNYTNITQLMTAMNENLSTMLDVVKSSQNTFNQYKNLLSIFKNNKTNVPYVKDINGSDYWFVNGKCVSAVSTPELSSCCNEISPEIVTECINTLMDDDPSNDMIYTKDPNECDCEEISKEELAEKLGITLDDSEDDNTSNKCECNFTVAKDEEISNILNK